MDQNQDQEQEDQYFFVSPKPDIFTTLVLTQADLIHNALSFLFSPALALASILSHSYHKSEQTLSTVQSAIAGAPATTAAIIRRLLLGAFGAAHACVVLAIVFCVSMVLGFVFVGIWVDEPIVVKEELRFDYSEVNPRGVFWFERKTSMVPIGHTFFVSVFLLVPESDYNSHVGVFQISAELLSTNGHVTAKSSLPCMLRFRSLPIRLARTFIMSVPLVLGLTSETQKITVDKVLKHKEKSLLRTEAIRVSLIPRAGTTFIPQIYEAKIVLASKLPWHRELVRRWKWTFRVWSTLYIFVFLVSALLCFCKALFFPFWSMKPSIGERAKKRQSVLIDDEELDDEFVNECLRKWRLRKVKGKRETISLFNDDDEEEEEKEIVGSSASTLTISREDQINSSTEEDDDDEFGDSESVCN